MSEIERIRDQLERAYRGGAWHGPSICEILDGVDAETASSRPIRSAHSIAELVVHVIAWEQEAAARLQGGGSDDLPPENDWPESSAAWDELLGKLDAAHELLMGAIGELEDSVLDEPVAGHPSTVYHLLHGMIQHNLYHAGQMAILKKAT